MKPTKSLLVAAILCVGGCSDASPKPNSDAGQPGESQGDGDGDGEGSGDGDGDDEGQGDGDGDGGDPLPSTPFDKPVVSGVIDPGNNVPPISFKGGFAFLDPNGSGAAKGPSLQLVFTPWLVKSCAELADLDLELSNDTRTMQSQPAMLVSCTVSGQEVLPESGEPGFRWQPEQDFTTEQVKWDSLGSLNCFPQLTSGDELAQSGRVTGSTRIEGARFGDGVHAVLGTLTFDLPYCGEFDAKGVGGE